MITEAPAPHVIKPAKSRNIKQNRLKECGSPHIMPSSIALGCGGYEAYAANPHSIRGFSKYRGSRFLLTETVRIKQNRAENAKPSQFCRVFLEVPGGLRRDNEVQQVLKDASKTRNPPEICGFRGVLSSALFHVVGAELTCSVRKTAVKFGGNRFCS